MRVIKCFDQDPFFRMHKYSRSAVNFKYLFILLHGELKLLTYKRINIKNDKFTGNYVTVAFM